METMFFLFLRFIFIFICLITIDADEQHYEFKIDIFNADLNKKASTKPESNFDIHPSSVTQRGLPTVSTQYYSTNEENQDLTIDIGSDVAVSSVTVFYYNSYSGIETIRLDSESGVTKTVKGIQTPFLAVPFEGYFFFPSQGFSSRYVMLKGYTNEVYIRRINVFVNRMDVQREHLLSSKVVAAAHPFTNYQTLDSLNGFSLINFYSMDPTDSLDYMTFDDAPMAWFLVKLHATSYITRYITSCRNHLPDTYLAYRYHDDREFILYKEDNALRIFVHDMILDAYDEHKLKSPFVASHIQIHMLFATPDFISRLDFRGYFADAPSLVHNIIHLHTVEKPTKSSEILITLPTKAMISGLRLHRVDVLLRFCLMYSNGGPFHGYKDNIEETEHTIFLGSVNTGWIVIKPTLGDKFSLECLEWEDYVDVPDLTITLRGENDSLATHRWTAGKKILHDGLYKGFHVFPDAGSGVPIFGNMKIFEKRRPDERLRSNFLGPDCLSRPLLCDKGFTVAFQVYGLLSTQENVHDESLISFNLFGTQSYDPRNSWVQVSNFDYFGIHRKTDSVKTIMFERFNCYVDIMKASLNIAVTYGKGRVQNISTFVAKDLSEIHELLRNESNWTKDFVFDGVSKYMNIDVTSKLQEFCRRRSLPINFIIALGAVRETNVDYDNYLTYINWKSAQLDIKKRIKVPKRITRYVLDGGGDFTEPFPVLAGLETDLIKDRDVKIEDVKIDDLTTGNLFKDGGMVGYSPERLYRPFKTPVFAENLFMDGEDYVNIYPYGGEKDYDSEEVLPIISCGIHGNDTMNQGTGFSIYYTSKGLYGIVKTEEQQFTVSAPLTHFKSGQWNSVVLRWTKDKITLDINDNPQNVGVSKDVNKTFSKPIFQNEYLLLFGQYHYQEAYSYGKFRRFYIWRYDIQDGQVAGYKSAQSEIFYFTSGQTYGIGFHTAPGCLSTNIRNFCNESILQNSLQAQITYEVEKYYVQEVGDDNSLHKAQVYWIYHDEESKYQFFQFDYVLGDFDLMKIEEVYINFTLIEPVENENCFWLCNETNTFHDYCTYIDLSDERLNVRSHNLLWMFMHQIENRKTKIKLFMKCDVNMTSAYLSIHYKIYKDDQGLVAYAHEEEASVWNINYPLSTKCIYFTYKVIGSGFGYLSIRDIYGGDVEFIETARFYLNDKEGESEQFQYESNTNLSEIQITVIKNGRGDGIFLLSSLSFSYDDCSTPINTFQLHYKDKSNFPSLHFIQYPLHDPARSTIDNVNSSFPIYNYIFEMTDTTNVNHEEWFSLVMTTTGSTILFWFYHKHGMIFGIKNIRYLFQMRSTNGLIQFFIRTIHQPDMDMLLKTEKWYFVSIFFYQERYIRVFIEDQQREKLNTGISTINERVSITFRFLNGYIVCLQYYQSYLTNLEVEQAKLCPTQHTFEACPGKPRHCAICDQINGGWKLKESRKQLTNDNCTHKFEEFGVKLLFSFDDVFNNSFFDTTFMNQIKLTADITYSNKGVTNSAVKFTGNMKHLIYNGTVCHQDNCFISTWIKCHCSEASTRLIMTKKFNLKCYTGVTENFVLVGSNCHYYFNGINGFWFHLFVEANGNSMSVYLDGKPVELKTHCRTEFIYGNEIEVRTRGSDWVLFDELVIDNENRFPYDIEAILNNYYLNDDSRLKGRPNYFINFYIGHVTWEEGFAIKGHKRRESVFRNISYLVTEEFNGVYIDQENFTMTKVSDKCGEVLLVLLIYGNQSDFDQLTKIVDDKNPLCKIEKSSRKSDYQLLVENGITETFTFKLSTKYSLIFQWTESEKNDIPLKGLYVTANNSAYNILANNTVYDIDNVIIDGLRGKKTYEVCIYPLTIYDDFPDYNFQYCSPGHVTPEAEPIEKPGVSCSVKSISSIECTVSEIDIDNYDGTPHGFQISAILTENIEDIYLDVDEWNLTKFINQTKPHTEHETYTFDIVTDQIYELYTIVAMATTRGGDGLGTRSNVTIRSHGGAPEKIPVLKSVSFLENATMFVQWNGIGNNDEYWNAKDQSHWLYTIHIREFAYNTFKTMKTKNYNISYQYDESKFYYEYHEHQPFEVYVTAKSEHGETSHNNSLCLLLDMKAPLMHPSRLLSVLHTASIPSIKSVNISLSSFLAVWWHGIHYYLVYAYADKQSNYTKDDVITFVKNHTCDHETRDYWLIKQCHYFNVSIDLEHYRKQGIPCNAKDFQVVRGLDTSQSFLISGFHPSSTYTLFIFPCNQVGCDSKNVATKQITTDEYKPGSGPENITLIALSSTSLKLSFGLIEPFYQHGDIQGYFMKLTCLSINISRYINETNDVMETEFDGLGKYENCCIIIAGFTSYPSLGNYSKPICNITMQDIPSIAPQDFKAIETESRSIEIEWKALNKNEWNGEPLHYSLFCNCLLRNGSMQDFQSNISADNTKYKFEGLYPYTECELSVAACTIVGCNVSKTINETTDEAVPNACPENILLSNRSSTCLNFTWDEIPIMQQNGIITKYEISLDGGVDSYVSTTSNMSISLCNLVKFHEYQVSIHGVNSAGSGEICSFMNSTDEDVPCPPKNFTVDTYYSDYLIVEWTNVPKHCRNGIITGFRIYYYEIDGEEIIGSVMVEFVVRKLRKAHLRKITAGSVYNVSMAALTSKGAGWKTKEFTKRLGIRVDGNWTDWTDWSPCSASCGSAFTLRSRDCVNPVPQNGGSNCTGDSFQSKRCKLEPCSGYGLAPPGQYDCKTFCTQLNMTCNEYLDTNFTIMLNDIKIKCNDNEDEKNWLQPKHPGVMKLDGEFKCIGYENIKNETVCDLENNPNEKYYQRICNCIHESDIGFGSWGEWSVCSITCGDSKRSIRARKCYNGKCTGPSTQKGNCRVPKCPVDGNWGSWTGYEHCNKSCGYGYENRRRFCNNPTPRYGGRNCTGPSIDSKGACNVQLCPVHGNWGEWTHWSSCFRPCNSSVKTRSRACDKPAPSHKGNVCYGNSTQTSQCYLKPCPNNWVHYVIMLKMQFIYQYNYLNHAVTMAFSQRLQDIFRGISVNDTNILDFIVRLFIRGSVIVHFDVLFDHIDEDQLIHISDTMELTKRFLDIDIGWFTVNTTTVPCPPPQNIQIKELNGGRVNISFDIEQCYDGSRPFQIYVFYINNEMTSQLNTWKWTGIFGNESSYIVVNDLIPMVTYRARLSSSSELGNGIPGDAVYFYSPAGPPLIYPPNLRHVAMSPTSIFIEWTDLPVIYRNGELLGYKVMYKQYFHAKYMEKTISLGFKNTILEDLKPFTWYIILVCAFNRGGNGPTDYSVVQTLEGVPSIPVPNMVVTDMQALDWWFVTWSRIPDEYVNGELIGYRLKYYLSYRSGQPIGGEKNEVKYDFDIYTFRHDERNLLSYATYNVTVTGFTKSGEGPTPEYYAKTCHCPEHLFGNWYLNRPYTKFENNQLEGIFPELIKDMILEACGSCSLYKKTKLHYYTSKTPFNPNTETEVELKRRISDEVDVSFPLYGRKEIQAIVPDSIFISMVSSPGCAIIVRNETNVDGILNSMIIGVVSVWPMLLVSYAIATLFGILVWFTDQFFNPDEFNIGSSIKGPAIGFWFSFVTMTTVGYGDITPRSFLAKTISMVWFLTGLVLNGIVVGFITSAVTSINIIEEKSLYNTLTGTVNNTFEQRYAVMRNAKSPSEVFINIDDVLDALSSSLVDAALIDIYSMASYKQILKEKELKVVSLIDAKTGYGLALSGMAQVLKPDIESLVIEKQNIIGGFVSTLESEIPIWEENSTGGQIFVNATEPIGQMTLNEKQFGYQRSDLSQEKAGSASADLFSAKSPAFLSSCIYMGCIILGLSIIGIFYDLVTYVKRIMKVDVEANEYDNYSAFADELLQLCTSIEDTVNNFTSNHTKEITILVLYHRAYNRKVQAIGKWRTDDIVAASRTKTGISQFSGLKITK